MLNSTYSAQMHPKQEKTYIYEFIKLIKTR